MGLTWLIETFYTAPVNFIHVGSCSIHPLDLPLYIFHWWEVKRAPQLLQLRKYLFPCRLPFIGKENECVFKKTQPLMFCTQGEFLKTCPKHEQPRFMWHGHTNGRWEEKPPIYPPQPEDCSAALLQIVLCPVGWSSRLYCTEGHMLLLDQGLGSQYMERVNGLFFWGNF